MKKASNKYVNYAIAFTLFGILVASLVMTNLEGFKEESKPKAKKPKTEPKKATPKELTPESLKETLSQLQHLSHLIKKDDAKSV
jgi:hypothetical protein